MKWTPSLLIVYANVVLYSMCFQLQRPIEPFLVERLGHGSEDAAQAYGNLQTFMSFFQTVGSPLMGIVLDKAGARAGFVVVFLGSAASYGLMACATSMWMLYMSKVPTVFQHAFLVSQTLVAQASTEVDRAEALGLLMTAYTIGATIGPAVGGILGASGDYYIGAWLATGGSLLSVVLSLGLEAGSDSAKDSNGHSEEKTEQETVSKISAWEGTKLVMSNPVILTLMGTKLLSSISNAIFQSASPVIFKENFHMQADSMGWTMSAMSLGNAVSGAFIIGPVSRRFSASHLVSGCLIWMAACYVGLAATAPDSVGSFLLHETLPSLHVAAPFVAISVVRSMAQFAMGTSLTALSTVQVPNNLKGTLVGMEHGVFSLARVGVPSLSVYILGLVGVESVCGICGCLLVGVLGIYQAALAQRIAKSEKGGGDAVQSEQSTTGTKGKQHGDPKSE